MKNCKCGDKLIQFYIPLFEFIKIKYNKTRREKKNIHIINNLFIKL